MSAGRITSAGTLLVFFSLIVIFALLKQTRQSASRHLATPADGQEHK